MRYIFLLLPIFLFSCTNQEPKPDDQKIQGLVGEYSEASRLVSPTAEKQVIETITGSKDTFVTVISQAQKSFVYYETSIDTFTKKYSGSVTNPPITEPPPSGNYGTLIHSSGFDKSSDINQYQGPQNSISTTIYKTAPGSFKSQAGTQSSYQSSGYRGEMQYTEAQTPVEGVYEYDVYYENWRSYSGGGHSVQWHPDNSGGSAVISLQNYGGLFNVVRSLNGVNTHQTGTLMKVEANRWYNLRWEIKFSTGNDGYIRLYIDGKLYYSYAGRTSSGGQYFKLGQNRWNTGGVNSVVYYDNLKIWKR